MKNTFCIFFVFVSSIIYAEKYAFIIAISDYPDELGWLDISSENDLKYVIPGLKHQNFLEKNIIIIKDKEATKNKIIKSIHKKLIPKLRKGDIVYFHFSGHGQQLPDKNGDELDGLDEAIVPYDHPFEYSKNIKSRLIIDDEIAQITDVIRRKIGPKGHMLLVLDSCHSGTANRGKKPKVRGTNKIFAPKSYKQEKGTLENEFEKVTKEEDKADVILFTASGSNELNYEITDYQQNTVGPLSYSIGNAFISIKQNETYKQLLNEIKIKYKIFGLKQIPTYYGDLDSKIFKGNTVSKSSQFAIEKVDNQIHVDGGVIHGINKGAVLNIFDKNGTFSTQATVLSSSINSSVIQLDELQNIGVLIRSFAEISSPSSENSLFYSSSFKNQNFESRFKKIISEIPGIKVSSNPDLIINDNNFDQIEICPFFGETISYIDIDDNLKKNLKKELKKLSFLKWIKSVEVSNHSYKAQVSIQSTKPKKESNPFKLDEKVDVIIENIGERDCYFAIVEINPIGDIVTILPNNRRSSYECLLPKGQKIDLYLKIPLLPPTGEYMIKVFTSSKPLNLPNFVNTRGTSNFSSDNFVKNLVDRSYRGLGFENNFHQIGVSTLIYVIQE